MPVLHHLIAWERGKTTEMESLSAFTYLFIIYTCYFMEGDGITGGCPSYSHNKGPLDRSSIIAFFAVSEATLEGAEMFILSWRCLSSLLNRHFILLKCLVFSVVWEHRHHGLVGRPLAEWGLCQFLRVHWCGKSGAVLGHGESRLLRQTTGAPVLLKPLCSSSERHHDHQRRASCHGERRPPLLSPHHCGCVHPGRNHICVWRHLIQQGNKLHPPPPQHQPGKFFKNKPDSKK